jgi:hypothetical protein
MRRIHLSIFCLWLFSTPSYGVVFTLFQQGKQVADYNWILRDLMTVPEIYEDFCICANDGSGILF